MVEKNDDSLWEKIQIRVVGFIDNLIYYNNKRRMIPLCILFCVIGIILGKFLCKFELTLKLEIIINFFINILILFMYVTDNDENEIEKNKFYKICFLGVNVLTYSILIYLNYNHINGLFIGIVVEYIPIKLYSLIVFTIIYFLPIILIYLLIFGRIKRTKITSSGIEVEIDDSFLSVEQHKIINDFEKTIERSTDINAQMDTIVADFILNEVVDDNNNLKSDYGVPQLLNLLTSVANDKLFKNVNDIVVEFTTVNNLFEIVKDYNLPSNIYRRIKARVDSTIDGQNTTFYEGNLVFLDYQIKHLSYNGLSQNRVIGIIEFKELKEGYVGYARLLLTMLKMLDYIMMLQIIPMLWRRRLIKLKVKATSPYIINIKEGKKKDYKETLQNAANKEASVNKVLSRGDAIHTINKVYAKLYKNSSAY